SSWTSSATSLRMSATCASRVAIRSLSEVTPPDPFSAGHEPGPATRNQSPCTIPPPSTGGVPHRSPVNTTLFTLTPDTLLPVAYTAVSRNVYPSSTSRSSGIPIFTSCAISSGQPNVGQNGACFDHGRGGVARVLRPEELKRSSLSVVAAPEVDGAFGRVR